MPWRWELLVKADSVVSSIMPRVSNSPHRGNLSLICPACLTVGTERSFNQWSDFPENQQSWGRKKILSKKCPLHKSQDPPTSRDQVHSICGVMQIYVFRISAFCKPLWKTIKLSISTSRSLHKLQTASLSVAWALHQRLLSLSEELLILIWPSFPLMTESTWYAHDSNMPIWNPKSFPKCNFIEQIACFSELDQQCFPLSTSNASEALNCRSDSLRERPR